MLKDKCKNHGVDGRRYQVDSFVYFLGSYERQLKVDINNGR